MGCRMLLTFILCVAWVLSWTAETARAQTSPIPAADYRVARVWKLGGVGGWDDLTLEESGARLFVSREERVDVIETVSGKLAGSIPRTGVSTVLRSHPRCGVAIPATAGATQFRCLNSTLCG